MSAIGGGATGPGVGVDLWLAARDRRMVVDLAATLDIESGLREAGWVRDDRRVMIHVVLDGTGRAPGRVVYLGCRATDRLDPCDMANIGHVIAVIRENRDVVGAGGSVYVHVDGHEHQRWSLDPSTPGTDPVVSELLAQLAPAGDERTALGAQQIPDQG